MKMSKLNHTTEDFDRAIRKVRSDYGDVTSVDATASDVVSGKVIVNSSKEAVTGNLELAEVSPSASISGDEVGDAESSYPISITPKVKVNTPGTISSVSSGETIRKYIKVQEKTVSPKRTEQEVVPSSNHLFSKVTVSAATVGAVIEGYHLGLMHISKPTTATSGMYSAYFRTGDKHDNVYFSGTNPSTNEKARLYLFRVGVDIPSEGIDVEVVDPSTKQIPSTTIVLRPGDSLTCDANTYAAGGILEFTSAGRITFQYTSNYSTGNGYGSQIWLLYYQGYYYIPCVDYKWFTHGYNGVGTYSKSGGGPIGGGPSIKKGATGVSFYNPKVLICNLTNIYYHTSSYGSAAERYGEAYEKGRQTFNYGLYEQYYVEDVD